MLLLLGRDYYSIVLNKVNASTLLSVLNLFATSTTIYGSTIKLLWALLRRFGRKIVGPMRSGKQVWGAVSSIH